MGTCGFFQEVIYFYQQIITTKNFKEILDGKNKTTKQKKY